MNAVHIGAMSVHELAEALAGTQPPVLIDCREAEEWCYCRIEGARHIPMSVFRVGFEDFERDAPIVVYCHHGIRSQAVAEFLARQGYRNVVNLVGGIDAWSLHIDPGVPRY